MNYDTVSEDDANGKDVGVDGQGHFALIIKMLSTSIMIDDVVHRKQVHGGDCH